MMRELMVVIFGIACIYGFVKWAERAQKSYSAADSESEMSGVDVGYENHNSSAPTIKILSTNERNQTAMVQLDGFSDKRVARGDVLEEYRLKVLGITYGKVTFRNLESGEVLFAHQRQKTQKRSPEVESWLQEPAEPQKKLFYEDPKMGLEPFTDTP